MLELGRILYPTDFSACARQALTHAIFVAELFEAELHVLHAITQRGERPPAPDQRFPDPEEILAHLAALAQSDMAELLRPLREKTLDIREVSERGIYPGPVILGYAERHAIDLIVMGTHGRRGAHKLLLGSVAEEVVRLAPCPVLTLRAAGDAEEEAEAGAPVPDLEAIHELLLPVDFSDPSREALVVARELAARFRARLQLVHVVEARAYPAHYGHVGMALAEHLDELKERSRQALEEAFIESAGPVVPHQVHVLHGRPSTEIARLAEEIGSDLIVQSTHGLSGLERLLLGSTAEAVLRLAPCPVLTLKAYGKSLIAG